MVSTVEEVLLGNLRGQDAADVVPHIQYKIEDSWNNLGHGVEQEVAPID